LDDDFALAHAFAGHIYVLRKQSRWTENVFEESKISVRHSRRAIELGREDALALALAGFNLAFMADELDLGAECIARALSMNSNLALGLHFGGWVNVYLGKHSAAVEHLARAERLSPRDPMLMQNNMATAWALFFGGKFDEAARLTERITSALPTFLPAWRVGAISYAMNGDRDRAAIAARKVLEFDPSARVSILVPLLPLRRPEDRERYREGLRAAGIPD
jgi:tetratricopeptide (TPR) repeat protein